MRVFEHPNELLGAVGTVFGPSDWLEIDQVRVNDFAVATGDTQWIHLDVERAASGPFGGTIAHGFLTLSLLPVFLEQFYTVNNSTMSVNYGLDRLRFVNPVRVGSRVRATGVVASETQTDIGVRLGVSVNVEIEGVEKPALLAELLAVFAS